MIEARQWMVRSRPPYTIATVHRLWRLKLAAALLTAALAFTGCGTSTTSEVHRVKTAAKGEVDKTISIGHLHLTCHPSFARESRAIRAVAKKYRYHATVKEIERAICP
jgi:hypothetical protein